MESNNNNFLKTLFVALILSILVTISTAADTQAGISVYWGRNSSEGSLRDACSSGLYKYVNLAYVLVSGDGSRRDLDLDGHCFGSLITCPLVGFDILYCQSRGIKVLLSLSGSISQSATAKSARDLADYIWNAYLGGWALIRPLGQLSLDGVDFAFTSGPTAYFQELAAALNERNSKKKKVYLSASPNCQTSGNYFAPAIKDGAFDYVWVQFYNDESCDVTAGFGALAVTWNEWSLDVVPSGTLVFAGFPAAPGAAKSGYVDAKELASILPYLKGENSGGVMIWNRLYDVASGYSKTILTALSSSGSAGMNPKSAAAAAAARISQVVSA